MTKPTPHRSADPLRASDNQKDAVDALMAERGRHIDIISFWWKRAKRLEIAMMAIARSSETVGDPLTGTIEGLRELAKKALQDEGVVIK